MAHALLAYNILMVVLISGAVIWAIKSGQFGRNSHASSLPLDIDEPDENNDETKDEMNIKNH